MTVNHSQQKVIPATCETSALYEQGKGKCAMPRNDTIKYRDAGCIPLRMHVGKTDGDTGWGGSQTQAKLAEEYHATKVGESIKDRQM
jgi:hypothetical protein